LTVCSPKYIPALKVKEEEKNRSGKKPFYSGFFALNCRKKSVLPCTCIPKSSKIVSQLNFDRKSNVQIDKKRRQILIQCTICLTDQKKKQKNSEIEARPKCRFGLATTKPISSAKEPELDSTIHYNNRK